MMITKAIHKKGIIVHNNGIIVLNNGVKDPKILLINATVNGLAVTKPTPI